MIFVPFSPRRAEVNPKELEHIDTIIKYFFIIVASWPILYILANFICDYPGTQWLFFLIGNGAVTYWVSRNLEKLGIW